MKKIWLVPALLALVCLSAGCGSRKDGRVLQSPEHTRTVEDYSAFIEETPLTETEMKAPGTETESVVLQTEIETEAETEPETENIVETETEAETETESDEEELVNRNLRVRTDEGALVSVSGLMPADVKAQALDEDD